MARPRALLGRAGVALGAAAFCFVHAPAAWSADTLVAGSRTKGGLAPGAQIVHVTTLADSGPGSLREAVELKGPRVIVFDVGGAIALASDLRLHDPFVTIAGQTAPSPGISLWNGSLRVRTHDVVIQHLAVRAGPAGSRAANDNRDAISIDGNRNAPRDNQSYEVRLENVSASWSVDEALSLWYETTHNVTIRHSIVAEALNNAGHPKGRHSMGLLIGTGVQTSEVTGNLLASNGFRNPVVGKGATAFVANNYIVNPGQNAIHFYPSGSSAPTIATVVNNVVEAGPSTDPTIKAVLVPMGADGKPVADRVFVEGNLAELGPRGVPLWLGPGLTAPRAPPIRSATWSLRPAQAVKRDVLAHAGTRPADRDPVDRRLLKDIAAGTEAIVDAAPETIDVIGSSQRTAAVPEDPFGPTASGATRLEAWLCAEHLAVGGAPSDDCPAAR